MSSIYDALQRLQENRSGNGRHLPERVPPQKNRIILAFIVAVLLSSLLTAGLAVWLGSDAEKDSGSTVVAVQNPAFSSAEPVRPETPDNTMTVGANKKEDVSGVDLPALQREAERLRGSGDIQGAIEIYAHLVDSQPDVLKNYLVLGTIYYDIGEYNKALVIYTKAMRYFKDDAVLLNNVGSVLLKKNSHDAALGYFKRAAEIATDNVEPVYNMACTYALKGEKEKAVELLKAAAAMHPDVIKWASVDNDLQGLRGDAGFDVLFE